MGQVKMTYRSKGSKIDCPICKKVTFFEKDDVESLVLECTECRSVTVIKIPQLFIKISNDSFINKTKNETDNYAQNLVEVVSETCYNHICSEENVRRRAISLINYMENRKNKTGKT